MQTRDKTLTINDYKGRPTDCYDRQCPCRPCWNAHDCGYSTNNPDPRRRWVTRMECATRHNNGCPRDEGGNPPKPRHLVRPYNRRTCCCCGKRLGPDDEVRAELPKGSDSYSVRYAPKAST